MRHRYRYVDHTRALGGRPTRQLSLCRPATQDLVECALRDLYIANAQLLELGLAALLLFEVLHLQGRVGGAVSRLVDDESSRDLPCARSALQQRLSASTGKEGFIRLTSIQARSHVLSHGRQTGSRKGAQSLFRCLLWQPNAPFSRNDLRTNCSLYRNNEKLSWDDTLCREYQREAF